MGKRSTIGWWVLGLLAPSGLAAGQTTRPGVELAGFEVSRHYGEQTREWRIEPEVKIHINAPAAAALRPERPTRLVLYALPNGNTTAQTIGRRMAEGVDWHYDIQHIGAQMRRLREAIPDENLVIAYAETDKRSWPAWKTAHEDYPQRIPAIVDQVRRAVGVPVTTVDLSGHSGGGSFVLGYLDGVERIPDDVRRIAFLDSNYGYNDEKQHGDKLIEWLRRGSDHCLCVIAYDDRNVKLDGKPIVGPTGGTWRATERMIERLRNDIELKEASSGDLLRYRGLDGRIDIILHRNPKNIILHTALVGEMSGFIHSMASGTPYEDKVARFAGPVGYRQWIQPD